MDIQKYEEKKQAGLAEVKKLGSAHALISKRFDSETGAELPTEIITLDIAALNKERETLVNKLAALDALLADIDSLN